MLAVKRFTSPKEMLDFIQGVEQASGTAGTNPGGSGSFQDLTAGAFTNVLPGDTIYISGESSAFVVSAKADNNNITVAPVIPTAHTAVAVWRAFRGGVGESALKLNSPHSDVLGQGHFIVFYKAPSFTA